MSILILNRDCLAKIFMQLSVQERLEMEQVCTKWQDACTLSWYGERDLKLVYNDCGTDERTVQEILIRCGHRLTSLSLLGNFNISLLSVIFQYRQNLSLLKTELVNHNDESYDLRDMPRTIEKVSLQGNLFQNFPRGSINVLAGCHNLTALELPLWTLSGDTVQIIMSMHSLKCLDLHGSHLAIPEDLRISLQNLERVNFSFCTGAIDTIVNDIITSNNGNVKHFNLSCCPTLSNATLLNLRNLRDVEDLILNTQEHLNDDIIRLLPALKIFECGDCQKITDGGILVLLQKSQNLEQLDVSTTAITIVTIEFIVKFLNERPSGKKLILTVDEQQFEDFSHHASDLLIFQKIGNGESHLD